LQSQSAQIFFVNQGAQCADEGKRTVIEEGEDIEKIGEGNKDEDI